jgi:hypothetical protein
MRKVGPAEILSLQKEKQNIKVVFEATGREYTFCVIAPRRVQDNFISVRIVNRLGLETHFNTAAVSSITWGSKRFSSTGNFVDLSLPTPGSAKSTARRFYIVEDCPFDMLLGTVATGPSLN